MAEEPDNVVLRILMQIQETQAQHTRLMNEHTREFTRLGRQLQDLQESAVTALGLAAHANVQHQSVQTQIEAIEDRLAEIDDLRSRLARLEEKV